MADKVKNQILRSMMAEESWQDTARRIRSEMGAVGQKSVWRAEMVARTELAHAQTVANTRLYAENADVIEKTDPPRAENPGREKAMLGYFAAVAVAASALLGWLGARLVSARQIRRAATV